MRCMKLVGENQRADILRIDTEAKGIEVSFGDEPKIKCVSLVIVNNAAESFAYIAK